MRDTEQQWLDRYLDHLLSQRRYSPHTIDNYRRDLGRLLSFCEAEDVEHWAALTTQQMRQFSAQAHRRGLGGRSVARLLSAARSFFHYLAREGLVTQNPVTGVSAPKSPRKLPEPLDTDQMARLLAIDASDPLALRDLALMELPVRVGIPGHGAGGSACRGAARHWQGQQAARSAGGASCRCCPAVLAGGAWRAGWSRRAGAVCQQARHPPHTACGCATPSPVICWSPVVICARYRNCWGMPISVPRRCTRTSTFSIWRRFTIRPIHGPGRSRQSRIECPCSECVFYPGHYTN